MHVTASCSQTYFCQGLTAPHPHRPGFIIQATLVPANWLPYLSNGIAWWLSVEPYELFFYIFLPPLLLDAALRIDTFRLRKVWVPVMCLAYVIVLCATGLLIPIMLYVFNLQSQGWCVLWFVLWW